VITLIAGSGQPYIINAKEDLIIYNNAAYSIIRSKNVELVLHNNRLVKNKETLACIFTTDLVIELGKYVYYSSSMKIFNRKDRQ